MNGRPAVSPGTGSRNLDERVWSVATRSAPIAVQFVLGVLLITSWLLNKWALSHVAFDAQRVALLAGTGVAVVISLAIATALLRRGSSTARGLGLSTAACAIVVLIGAIPYAFWLF